MSPSQTRPHPSLNAFSDSHGRHLLFRGLNVSGDAKYPIDPPLAGTPEFYDVSRTSYVGRPFKSGREATEWWRKMKRWGVSVVRLVVCWEALEPRKMGLYDETYIAYIRDIIAQAGEEGLAVFIDGHQDVWSRFSGGSGAPLWTFHLAGLDPTKFPVTCSVAIDPPGTSSPLSSPAGRLWPTNYSKFAVATMFTLFFGGELYAPQAVLVDPSSEFHGKNIGHVLRTAYIRAFSHLFRALDGLDNVLGIDPMNEPHPGYIGLPSLFTFNENTELHLGFMPKALDSMLLAAGVERSVPLYTRSWPHPSQHTKSVVFNTSHTSAWLPGRSDIWQQAGVYTVSSDLTSFSLGPKGAGFFLNHPLTNQPIDFEKDCYVPFLRAFRKAIPAPRAKWLFVEPVPNLGPPIWPRDEGEHTCYAPHWYDIRALYEKALSPRVTFDVLSLASGSRNFLRHTYFNLTNNYAANFSRIAQAHLRSFRHDLPDRTTTPIMIGETGVPMDINRLSYYRGDANVQETMMDAVLSGMERYGLNYTLWNLSLSHSFSTPPIAKTHNETGAPSQAGDGWNSEDFSVVSLGIELDERACQFEDLYSGLRIPNAFLRPYPLATAGELLKSSWEYKERRFEMAFIPKGGIIEGKGRETEVFLPLYHFGTSGERVFIKAWSREAGVLVEVTPLTDGEDADAGAVRWRWDRQEQRLTLWHSDEFIGKEVGIGLEVVENYPETAWSWFGWIGWLI